MFKKILIAVDGSDHSLKAAKIGGNIARSTDAEIFLVTAFDKLPDYLGEPYVQDAISERLGHAENIVEGAKTEIGDIPGKLTTETIEGHPADVILSVAGTRKVDLIVMGTRGLGSVKSVLQGSQSQKVVAHSDCPVLLVK